MRLMLVGLTGLTLVSALACKDEAPATTTTPKKVEAPKADPAAEALQARVAQFAPAELTADISKLPATEKKALMKIIEASRLMDEIFTRQAWAGAVDYRAELAKDTSDLGKAKLAYFDIMRGPWDRQKHWEGFAIESAHPKGAGFYPEDMTVKEFKDFVAANPKAKDKLESLFTVVERKDGKLAATPYSKAYAKWLVPAAKLLREAAEATEDKTLAKFLKLRAEAFETDDYYESDKAWMDLDSAVEVTIGPYETYEDELLGLKASFESFVTITDPVASKNLALYKDLLPKMEANLPVGKEMKTTRGAESPIRVVDLVFTSGDARKSVQTIAFNLPNDERVRKEKGAKKVMLRNIIEEKFERILRPIAVRLLDDSQEKFLSSKAFFNEVLFHELSHSLGPAYVKNDGKTEVRMALGASYSPLEEAKADVMGAYNVLYMIDQEHFPATFRNELLVSYFMGLFRSVRFGVSEAHGKGAALQLNRFIEEKAAIFNAEKVEFKIDLAQLEKSISKLVTDIVTLQHNGDKAGVDALMGKYGVMTDPIEKSLKQVTSVPVDLSPRYPLAK